MVEVDYMKLDENSVLQHVFEALSARATEEKRDGLPVVTVEGIPCAVDILNRTLQTGEKQEQRWFEVTLHDVTPRRFLGEEEQDSLILEQTQEWWMVSGRDRTAFVRATSRRLAMKYFADKFHEDAVDCECAYGFSFIDPTEKPLEEPETKASLSTETLRDSEVEDSPEKDPSEMPKAEDYYFGIGKAEIFGGDGGNWLMLCPRKYWDENHVAWDGGLSSVSCIFPPYLKDVSEDMECTWMLEDELDVETVAKDLEALGFERNYEFEGLYESVHNS